MVAVILPLGPLGDRHAESLGIKPPSVAQTKTPEQRKQLEDMADMWDRLARERRVGIVENKHDQA